MDLIMFLFMAVFGWDMGVPLPLHKLRSLMHKLGARASCI